MGDILALDSIQQAYMLQCLGGRFGTGIYEEIDGESTISFDGFVYSLKLDGDTLNLDKNGSGSDEETLIGPFERDSQAEMITYSIDNLNGRWVNENGETIIVTSDLKEYSYDLADKIGSGNINDDKDGKGLYFFMNGGRGYIIMSSDRKSFSIQPFDDMDGFDGIFAQDDGEGGESAPEDISPEQQLIREAVISDFFSPNDWVNVNDGSLCLAIGTSGEWSIYYANGGNYEYVAKGISEPNGIGGIRLVADNGAVLGIEREGDKLVLTSDGEKMIFIAN